VPEIYIQKETDEEGETIYAIIDGQQRIRTLLEFPRNDFELLDKYSSGREGQNWEELTKQEKVNYWNYRLVVREISDASDEELRDLFRRLNQHTVVLNAQEIRNARFKGDFIQTVTELADQDFWAENRIASANEIRRMLDIEFIAELLIGIMHGPQNKKTTLDPLFESYDDAIPEKQKWLKRFETARDTTEQLVADFRSSRWRGKSDYYSLFLAAAELTENGRLQSSKLQEARKTLKKFGEAVSLQLTKEESKPKASKDVRRYATAVEKAASDKDRRQSRHEILIELLEKYFT
jgi:hypothetical protein